LFLLIAIFVSFKLIQRKVKIRVEELSNQEEETIEENLPPTAEEQKQMWGENSIMSNNQLPIEDIQSLIPDIQSLIPEIDIEDLLADVQKGDLQSTNNFDSSLLNDLLDKKEPNISEAVIKEESINRLIKKNCSSCDLLFSVQLPENIDIARTACPKCGSIEDVSIL
jgi:hypothetical protein